MKPPQPIRLKSPVKLELSIVGMENPEALPYLYVETRTGSDIYGYIEDKDVKRLLAWCECCLSRKKEE